MSDSLDCTAISKAYTEYKDQLCSDVRKGWLELLALRVISLPLEIGLCILGIRIVIRNKVDVPKYVKTNTDNNSRNDLRS